MKMSQRVNRKKWAWLFFFPFVNDLGRTRDDVMMLIFKKMWVLYIEGCIVFMLKKEGGRVCDKTTKLK